MTSLTTMFIVGKDEYVEFNESWGSKAFLEHVWDHSQTPLDQRDVSSGHLHSAGARISQTPPPRIEFPTVYRVKGKGNTYRASGKYISWDELARLNPLAVKAPPSLDDFLARGGEVGSGPRLKPGELLRRDEPMAKVRKQASAAAANGFSEEDGWIGGSKESIYATTNRPAAPCSPTQTQRNNQKGHSRKGSAGPQEPETPERKARSQQAAPSASSSSPATLATPTSDAAKPKSLLERLGIDEVTTPPPKPSLSSGSLRTTPSPGIRRPGAKIPSPLPLTSPARNNGPLSPSGAATPLSASHPPPETPLKMSHRGPTGGPQTPATPHHPLYAYAVAARDDEASRASGLGLGLTPHKPTIPLAHLGSPEGRHGLLQEPQSHDGSPSYPVTASTGGTTSGAGTASGTASSSSAGSQIEAMLERLRKARTGLGTEASMWAPKSSASAAGSDSSPNARSHAAGVSAASDKLSTAMGIGRTGGSEGARRRPGHRHNGLQLSLGQGIEVMQNLDEKAEDDEAEAAEDDGWLGTIVPPTPALGSSSPRFDGGGVGSHGSGMARGGSGDGPGRGSGSAGLWGAAVASSPEVPKAPLVSTTAPRRISGGRTLGLDEVWSGDDDDDDVAAGRGGSSSALGLVAGGDERARSASRSPASSKSQRAPPPALSYGSRTPSPSHPQSRSPAQLDASNGVGQDSNRLSPSLAAAINGPRGQRRGSQTPSPRLSPSLTPSPIEDSDGDADAEDDMDIVSRNSRRSRVSPSSRAAARRDDTSPSDGVADLDRTRRTGRGTTERKRGGRRSSQAAAEAQPIDSADAASSDQKHSEVPPPPAAEVEEAGAKTNNAAAAATTTSAGADDRAIDKISNVAASTVSSTSVAAASSATDLPETPPRPQTIGDATAKATAETSVDTAAPPSEAKVTTSQATPSAALAKASADDARPDPSPPDVPTDDSAAEAVAGRARSETESSAGKVTVARSESGIDWAEDEDDTDDALPDLDDWGYTMPATPSSKSAATFGASQEPAAAERAKPPAPTRGAPAENRPRQQRPAGRPDRAAADGAGRGPPWKRGGDRSSGASEGRGGKGAGQDQPPKGPLGIRIAGRAAAAAAAASNDRPLHVTSGRDGSQGRRGSVQSDAGGGRPGALAAAAATHGPPPAATPYGRWKTGGAVAAANANAAAAAMKPAPSEDVGITIRGSGKRHAPPVSPSSGMPAGAKDDSRNSGKHGGVAGSTAAKAGQQDEASSMARKERPAVRPRVAADSGAFARLMGATVSANNSTAPITAAPAAGPRPVTPTPPTKDKRAAGGGSGGAAASMHAPKQGSDGIVTATAPVPSPAASKISVRLPGAGAAGANGNGGGLGDGGKKKNHPAGKATGERVVSNGSSGGGGKGGGRGGRKRR